MFLARVLMEGPAALVVCDAGGIVTMTSRAAVRLLGADPTGLRLDLLLDPPDQASLSALAGPGEPAAAAQPGRAPGRVVRLRVPGSAPVRLRVHGERVADGATSRPVLALIAAGDLSETWSQRLDALTGVMGRESFLDRLRLALACGCTASMAIIALDGFKVVNDLQGHATGD